MSLLLSLVAFAHAQIDPGQHPVYQADRQIGWVYVPEGQDSCRYVEYWFLEAGYAFPSLRNGVDLTVRSSAERSPYATPERFVAAMLAEHPDGTWIESRSVETRDGCR